MTELGAEATRAELQALYGGGRQGGILASTKTPNILVFTDPSAGKQHGYNFDGWDPDGSVYNYTGEGQTGDQTLTSGNKSLLNHAREGRALRLFKWTGRKLSPGGKVHSYLGEFVVDADRPYRYERAPDNHGDDREVVVFHLKAKGDVVRLPPVDAPHQDALIVPTSTTVPLEQWADDEYDVAGREPGKARRHESALVERYKLYLQSRGHEVERWRIQFYKTNLYTDLWDQTDNELYEVKSNASRPAVRMAVGQLLDYRRFLKNTAKLAVLLPERPSDDLLDYIASVKMGCVYATGESTFERHSP